MVTPTLAPRTLPLHGGQWPVNAPGSCGRPPRRGQPTRRDSAPAASSMTRCGKWQRSGARGR
jgi:hypothetical protein